MENRNGEVHIETDEARGGSTPHIVRWVLGISLLAAILLLSVIWMTGAATTDAQNPNQGAAANRAAAPGTTTDGIVNQGSDVTEFQTTPESGALDSGRVQNRAGSSGDTQ